MLFARNNEDIDKVIQDLKMPNIDGHESFLPDEENDVAGFFGNFFEKIKISAGQVSEIKLLQTGLIKRILAVTGMEDCLSIKTPAEINALIKDKKGD